MPDIGKIQPREITEEMRESYLDYAMSVIVARALPDARDGLKPVHRRILYGMYEVGLRAGAKHRKSATVIGEVMGKYHPHGDAPIYDALARMAQDFSLRYPLIDGQGNFGSMDGDPPAAMRYTEARFSKISEEMLADIEKETVDFVDNYDGTKKEPVVLPTKVPQLLLNGSVGIAVGMATSIPPHNLTEVVDALVHLIDHAKATNEDLLEFIKGPDFPTGGAIYNRKNILQAYATGKGPIVTRGKAEILEAKKGAFQIVVSEITYQVNKASLLETIANLVKNKKLEGIKDVRDESDKEGVRIVIDLKSDAQPQKILNRLWKMTDLQKTFHLNMLALVDGLQPQVLSVKSLLELYLKHRQQVVERRSRYELRRAEERAHILEGLAKALSEIDAVIKTIKGSPTKEEAHRNLIKKFDLSEAQATAILEMRLATLAGLEQKKITDELKEKKELIAYLKELLGSEKKIWGVVKKELEEIRATYKDERRTTVHSEAVGEISEEDLVPQEEVIIALSRNGYIKRLRPDEWHAQRRGGQGKRGAELAEEDVVEHLMVGTSHDTILFFTSSGKVYRTRAYEIPVGSRQAKGRAIVNFLAIDSSEKITAIIPIKTKGADQSAQFLVMVTRNGIIKKTAFEELANIRANGLIAIRLKKNDTLEWVKPTSGRDEIILVSQKGQAIRFSEKDVRPMGRTAAGVIGMKIREAAPKRGEPRPESAGRDEVTGMDVIPSARTSGELDLLVVLSKGYGKKTQLKHYKRQRRGGVGVRTARVGEKSGLVVAATILDAEAEDLIAISKKGQVIRTPLKEISRLGRATQGVRVMRLKAGDEIASITTI